MSLKWDRASVLLIKVAVGYENAFNQLVYMYVYITDVDRKIIASVHICIQKRE